MGYTYKKIKDKLTLTSYNGNEEIVRIPSEIDGYIVSKIASMCFFDIDEIKEIYFPENDIIIENNAIVCCCNLEKIYIPTASKLGNFIEDCDKAQVITSNPSVTRKMKRKDMGETIVDLSIFECTDKEDGSLHLTRIQGLNKLTSIKIPNTINGKKITSLAKYLFRDCVLDSITLNDYITSIPHGCFQYARIGRLENVENIEIVESQGFYSISLSEPIHLENLKKVHSYGFCYFNGELSWGNKLELLEEKAFRDSSLVTVSLRNFNGVLPDGLFEDCEDLKLVILPKKTTVLPPNFFDGCYGLEEIEGIKNIVRFERDCLRNCRSLVSTINFKKVEFIGSSAFAGCSLQRTIRIGNCELESSAFADIEGCEHIIFDNAYTKDSVPVSCFRDSKIRKVTLNSSIKRLERYCFLRSTLTSINTEHLEKIEEETFKYTFIKKLVLDSIKEFSSGCFSSMRELKFVDLSKSNIVLIPSASFESCIKLKEVLLPHNLKEIGRFAFAYSAITKLELPNTIEKIASSFICGTKIREIIIPESVKRICSQTFTGLTNVTIKILAKDISFDSQAFSRASIKELDLSHINMTSIPAYMFEGANISNLKLPDGITRIGMKAFCDCDIKHLEMDTSKVEYIDSAAFY